MGLSTQESLKLMDVCLLAGEMLLRSGAETHRVEDTMTRMAAAYTDAATHSFVTPTGIVFSIDKVDSTKLVRILDRSTNLHRVVLINQLSREMSKGSYTIDQAYEELQKIKQSNQGYPLAIKIAAAAISSGCFLIMYNGVWNDFLPALIAGGIGYSAFSWFHFLVKIKFFAECLAALVIGIIALIFVKAGWGQSLDTIIIGSVMPLVPGVLITNAIRDLIAGHLVAGLSKGIEAFLTAFAIGTGIAFVLAWTYGGMS
ncbi:threonine/serine exporter family protein [Pullulanibacillus sp. KACC 23026]|uniref:threonine/serine exporter family protein n=1 Tax=Pullulanibacillus sp. KACC 23026 TaxID=3028315 RepID=UPI0023B14E81|nr:threonine/serine exporter family protein [Pullulanibacillus sp. KACC 23026]WEG13011.1 threonine/serine exporter family protein [Pullulanibacillus sp. KACC 23026]